MRETFCSIFILSFCATVLSQSQNVATISCPKGYKLMEDNLCIRVAVSDRRYEEASRRCRNHGGKLFEPRTKVEVEAVRPFLAKGLYWLGINDFDNEGWFKYNSSGRSVVFTDWRDNQPRNAGLREDCVVYFNLKEPNTTTWKNMKCKIRHRYICQAEPINDCYEPDVLYLPSEIPYNKFDDCLDACRNVSACEFVNYGRVAFSCELGDYLPSNFVSYSNMLAGTKTFGTIGNDNVWVGYAEKMDSDVQCHRSCQSDGMCKSFTYWHGDGGSQDNSHLCVHNYHETVTKRHIDHQMATQSHFVVNQHTGLPVFTSGPKWCNLHNVPVIDNEANPHIV